MEHGAYAFEMPRLFIAIPVPPLKRLIAINAALQRFRPQVRPVHPDLLHVTLRFLGETPVSDVPRIAEAIGELGRFPALELRVAGLGRFPRVIYARIEPLGPVKAMADALDAKLPGRDKPLRPHLTLARLRGRVRPERLDAALATYLDGDLGRFLAKDVHLIESRLGGGSRYTALRRQRLGGGPSC
jgi:2'-5' RNA ligase